MIQLLRPLLPILALLLASNVPAKAEVAEPHRGYWLLVNSSLVLNIDAAGAVTLVNSGQTGTIKVADDGAFDGMFGETPLGGKFAEGKLWIRSGVASAPASMELLEFRKVTDVVARELVTFLRKPRASAANDVALAFRASVADAIRNRLNLLSESVMFHCLENNLQKVNALADLIGPEKQLSALPSIDGEDYSKLDLTPNTSWTIESPSGIKVSLEQ